jgi:hypothetical protein
MSLRNQLRAPGVYAKLGTLPDEQFKTIADVSVAVDTPEAATFLLDHIGQLGTTRSR